MYPFYTITLLCNKHDHFRRRSLLWLYTVYIVCSTVVGADVVWSAMIRLNICIYMNGSLHCQPQPFSKTPMSRRFWTAANSSVTRPERTHRRRKSRTRSNARKTNWPSRSARTKKRNAHKRENARDREKIQSKNDYTIPRSLSTREKYNETSANGVPTNNVCIHILFQVRYCLLNEW